jgi:hypothetical protein
MVRCGDVGEEKQGEKEKKEMVTKVYQSGEAWD